MINFIWAGLIIIGILVGAATGNMEAVTNAAIDNAKVAVEICLGLIGVMAMWLGIMRIAEESGFVEKLGNFLRPVLKKLFPGIPENHPAMGAIIMNVAANMLGLGNAATPFGIKAMKELQEINPSEDTATDDMVMFLGINTSSVTLIPISTIAILSEAGSKSPTEIIGPTLIATITSTVVAIIAAKALSKLPKYSSTNPLLVNSRKEVQ